MSSTTATKMTISKDEWNELLQRAPLSKGFLNNVVMEYLVIEGHRDAAAALERESGCQPQQSLQSIEDRVNVRNAIMAQDIPEALAKINEINPKIPESNPKLHFRLYQQQTCDLIAAQEWPQALTVAQTHLAKLAELHNNLLEDLEKTMSLFAFIDPYSSPFGSLLSMEFRLETAHQANTTLLEDACQSTSSRIPEIIRTLLYSQETLHKQHNIEFPRLKEKQVAFGGFREGSWDTADTRTQIEMDTGVYSSVNPVLETDYESPKEQSASAAATVSGSFSSANQSTPMQSSVPTTKTDTDTPHDRNGKERNGKPPRAAAAATGKQSNQRNGK